MWDLLPSEVRFWKFWKLQKNSPQTKCEFTVSWLMTHITITFLMCNLFKLHLCMCTRPIYLSFGALWLAAKEQLPMCASCFAAVFISDLLMAQRVLKLLSQRFLNTLIQACARLDLMIYDGIKKRHLPSNLRTMVSYLSQNIIWTSRRNLLKLRCQVS